MMQSDYFLMLGLDRRFAISCAAASVITISFFDGAGAAAALEGSLVAAAFMTTSRASSCSPR
ncbi:MAG TPA: hypothetical protein VIG06_24555, partial [Kofleriaceae bacterium]